MKRKQFKFSIGQVIRGEKITDRWHGKDENFYDMRRLSNGLTWTYDEKELEAIRCGKHPYKKEQ